MSNFYIERNGRAQQWDRDHDRLELARWVYHHPENLAAFVDKLAEYGIDLFTRPTEEKPNYSIEILIHELDELSKQDIDNITGVDLDGSD